MTKPKHQITVTEVEAKACAAISALTGHAIYPRELRRVLKIVKQKMEKKA
jgi:hypothetical protein